MQIPESVGRRDIGKTILAGLTCSVQPRKGVVIVTSPGEHTGNLVGRFVCVVFNQFGQKHVGLVFLPQLMVTEVVATTVLEGVCDADGRLNVQSTDFFGMTAGSGEFYTMGPRVGHIGQSVGRTDIKY